MKPTPEQYREAACALIRAGAPLDARSGPGEHVQQLTPPDGRTGAFVEVYVWVPEESVAGKTRLEKLTADEPLPDEQLRRRPRAPDETRERLEAMQR